MLFSVLSEHCKATIVAGKQCCSIEHEHGFSPLIYVIVTPSSGFRGSKKLHATPAPSEPKDPIKVTAPSAGGLPRVQI